MAEEVAVGKRRGLADVVEEGRQPDDRPVPRRRVHGPQRVVPQVLARDLVLGDAALGGELRRDRRQQARVGQQPQPDRRRRRARGASSSSAAIRSPDRWPTSSARAWIAGQRRGLDPEPEGRGEPDGADHPQGVLLEPVRAGRRPRAGCRRAMSASPPYGSTSAVPRLSARRQPRPPQAIALTVKSRRARSTSIVVAELDPVRTAEVGVVVVGPERRDLEHVAVVADGDRPERVLVDGAGKELDRACSGSASSRQVPVGRSPAQQGVAQRSTHDVRRMPGRRAAHRGLPAGRARPGSRPRRRPAVDRVGLGRQFRPRKRYAPPRVVAVVGEIRREQRVDVAPRLERRAVAAAAAPRRASCRPCGDCTACTRSRGSPRCGRRRDGAARRGPG